MKEGYMMEYITLNNGIEMPLLGLGTWNLNGQECVNIVATAIELGYCLIDTAQMYGNEKEVGKGIKRSNTEREKLFVTTKLYRKTNSYDAAKKAINESLCNLRLDYIDLLLLHEPYAEGNDMYKALEEAYREGKVHAIGVSNYDQEWFETLIKQCSIVPSVNQVETHLYYQKWDLQNYLNSQETAMQAWSPLAQGKADIMHHPQLQEIAYKYHKTASQIALRFLTQRCISVIPKSKRGERLIENISIFDFQLSDIEMQEIRKLDKNETLFSWTLSF